MSGGKELLSGGRAALSATIIPGATINIIKFSSTTIPPISIRDLELTAALLGNDI
jgi:hypothetical protein